MNHQHILVIRLSAMGDVAMTVPVIAALADAYPELRITILSRGFARAFFENLSPNVFFMEADFKNEYRGIHGLNVLYRRLKAKNFTAVADLHDVLRTKYLRLRFLIGGCKVKHINKHRSERKKLVRKNNKVLQQIPTSFENYQDVFSALGFTFELKKDREIGLGSADNDHVLSSVIGEKQPNERWIGIAPFAAHQGKIYPIDKMENVVKELSQDENIRIFFFGAGKKEKDIINEWCSKYARCVNASEKLGGLNNELLLMRELNVMLSMDSANMHLASLTGTPVVSIWGATHPYAGFMGWRQSENNAIQLEMECRPCSIYGNQPCHRNDYACMNQISEKQIIQKIRDIIQ